MLKNRTNLVRFFEIQNTKVIKNENLQQICIRNKCFCPVRDKMLVEISLLAPQKRVNQKLRNCTTCITFAL
jgi:hypothetical protein